MAYDSAIPVAGQSPGNFPAQSQENFGVLKTIIEADHQFNATPAPNDNSGYHKVTRWVNTAGALGDNTPAAIASTAQFYTKSLNYLKEGGTTASTREVLMQQPGTRASAAEETALGAAPICAAGRWNANSSIQGATFNVSDVSYTSVGSIYTVTMSNAMPNTNYIVIVSPRALAGVDDIIAAVVNNSVTSFDVIIRRGALANAITMACDFIVLGGWVS